MLTLNAKTVNGKLDVTRTDTATPEKWDWVAEISVTRDLSGTPILAIYATQFEVNFNVGPAPAPTPAA